MTSFTVLGGGGFIGSQLSASLNSTEGVDVYTPMRPDISDSLFERDLGHVFYCIGLTANFRGRPFDTVEAHVCFLKRLLERGRFETLTYLSSTRVYENALTTHETTVLQVLPTNPGHLYNLSKLLGESLCLAGERKARVVRLSNVFGDAMPEQTFISQVLHEAARTGRVRFLTAAQSAKDYVSIADVVAWLPKIAEHGTHAIYNVASGKNISNADIASWLEQRGIAVDFSEDAQAWIFPVIDTDRLSSEFGCARTSLDCEFDHIFNCYLNMK